MVCIHLKTSPKTTNDTYAPLLKYFYIKFLLFLTSSRFRLVLKRLIWIAARLPGEARRVGRHLFHHVFVLSCRVAVLALERAVRLIKIGWWCEAASTGNVRRIWWGDYSHGTQAGKCIVTPLNTGIGSAVWWWWGWVFVAVGDAGARSVFGPRRCPRPSLFSLYETW